MKTIITTILAELKNEIQNLVDAHVAQFEKRFERKMSKFDLEMTELYIIADMVKSVEKYTSNDDFLVSVVSSVSNKGNLQINAIIERNEKQYTLTTDVIYAGGYNIQQLHYRYITNTNLPKTGNNVMTTEYANKIKKMTKLEKLNEQLGYDEKTAEKYLNTMTKAMNMTDEQIIEELKQNEHRLYSGKYTWESLNEQGKKNYGSKEQFEQKAMNDLQCDIAYFKHSNIILQKLYLKSINKAIEKTKAKIASL